jgi:hypothetical protein
LTDAEKIDKLRASCCSTCNFNPANSGKTAGEASPCIAPMYRPLLNDEVAMQIIWKGEAERGMVHLCNQTNPAFGFSNPKPCRGFMAVLIDHVRCFDERGYTAYSSEKGFYALSSGQIGFWSRVLKILRVEP